MARNDGLSWLAQLTYTPHQPCPPTHPPTRIIAVSSSIAVSLTLVSLHYNWGLIGLWSSMIFAYFSLRILAHIRRCA